MFKRNFQLEVFFSEWEFKAKYLLGSSDMETHTLSEILALAAPEETKRWQDLPLSYTETWGLPDLREAIAATYETLGPENILCFAGAEEGIFCAMHALLKKGDHAIVAVPNYQSAETVPLGLCEVSALALDPGNNWTIDLDRLKNLLRPNTRLISINFPNNPTGKILERDKFDALLKIAEERGITIFSDEVYRLIERKPSLRLPQAADVYDKAFSLNVMSKAYGLPGLRIGWIASKDTEALLKMERIKHYLSICNSGPSEVLALITLRHRDQVLERNRKIAAANLKILERFFKDHKDTFEWYRPDGGCIAFPRYTGPGEVAGFARALIEETGVMIVPASVYASDLCEVPPGRFRIGFGRKNMPEALEIVEGFLDGRRTRARPG